MQQPNTPPRLLSCSKPGTSAVAQALSLTSSWTWHRHRTSATPLAYASAASSGHFGSDTCIVVAPGFRAHDELVLVDQLLEPENLRLQIPDPANSATVCRGFVRRESVRACSRRSPRTMPKKSNTFCRRIPSEIPNAVTVASCSCRERSRPHKCGPPTWTSGSAGP